MAIFKYNLPSGDAFDLLAPAGTTQDQADFIFYSQVAAGSLVGYSIGQVLTSAQTRLTNFELSRLERDTAGIDRLTILSIITGQATGTISSLTTTVPSLAGTISSLTTTIPSLANIPLIPITAADYADIPIGLGLDPVGPLSPEEVQGIITTTAVYVDQQPTTITNTGVGTYNLTPDTLEKAGYLKPGTANYPDFACVIGTPSVWTGKDGVTSIAGILDDPILQTKIQNGLLQNSYDALTASGTIQTSTTSAASLSTGQLFGIAGLTTLSAGALVSGTAALTGNLNRTITSAFSGVTALGGDAAARVSGLLSTPVNNISTIASGAVNGVTQSIANLSTTAVGAANAAVGAVINNAAQFTAPVAAAWAQGSAALNAGLGSAQGVLNSAVGQAQGVLTGAIGGASGLISGAVGQAQGYATNALGSLSGLATGALGSLGTQAQTLLGNLGGSLDIFGKMSSFSVDFSLFSSDSLVSATKVAAGFSNTVNRQTVDAAVTRILGNAKIPTPSFEFPSAATAGINADIAQAQAKLSALKKEYLG